MILLVIQYLIYAVIGILVYHIIKHYLNPNKYLALGIRGPTELPIIGHAVSYYTKGFRGFDFHNEATYGQVYTSRQVGFDTITILDLEILKQVLIKDFSNFTNRLIITINDDYATKQLTALKDDEWKRVRNKMSPAFSGAKMKAMMEQLNRCALTLRHHVLKKPQDVDVKSSFNLFTMDAIASTAFGINIDAASNPENEFMLAAYAVTKMFTRFNWRVLLLVFFPKLFSYLNKRGATIFPKESMEFFQKITEQTIQNRKATKSNDRCDFLQMMLEAESEDANDKTSISRTEIIAQAILFFFAGFETVSIALSFLMFNIARHADIQERLRREISDICNNEEAPTYDQINKLEYLDMTVQESLRLYPPQPRIQREIRKTVEINGITLLKDTFVDVPIGPIHKNPQLWPEPDKFKPERFSAEEKAKRHPLAWLPFGAGPRVCIAQRLAMIEIKVAAYHLLRNNKITISNKMEAEPVLDKSAMLRFKGGTYLDWEVKN